MKRVIRTRLHVMQGRRVQECLGKAKVLSFRQMPHRGDSAVYPNRLAQPDNLCRGLDFYHSDLSQLCDQASPANSLFIRCYRHVPGCSSINHLQRKKDNLASQSVKLDSDVEGIGLLDIARI